jgi:DNA polymerase III epsilon subunit-like protein
MLTGCHDKSNLSLKRDLNNNLGRAGNTAINWLAQKPIYISTKTSGFGEYSQIIELAVLDANLNVLFHSQFMPSVDIDREAQALHGINLSALQDRPKFSELVPQLRKIVANRKVIMFNGLFETRIMKQSCFASSVAIDWIDDLQLNCAMYLSANAYGTDNRYGTTSIENAFMKAKITGFSQASGAVAANYALALLVRNIAQYTLDINKDLEMSLQLAG